MLSNASDTLSRLLDIGIIPIVRIPDAGKVSRVAEALIAGGIPALEISLSLPGSLAILETVAKAFGEKLTLGAGTVLSAAAVRDAVAAGARYIVAPNTDNSVIQECKKAGVPVFPGALTPTEIMAALGAGADAIKVFPCDAMGGPGYIRSLLAPFPGARLFPCGGVSEANAADYFSAGAAALFTGTRLVDTIAVETSRFDTITGKARQLSLIAGSARSRGR